MFMNPNRILQTMAGAALALAVTATAQAPAAPAAAAPAPAPAAPAPLSTPAVTGPISWLPPAIFDAGPLGKLSVNGIVTGFSQFQNNPVSGDDTSQATLSNGQIFIQKADGKFQYFIDAGAYTFPTLSVPYMSAQDTVKNTFGAVPIAFAKVQAGKTTQIEVGALPTLIGAEGTFTFQNMNIERGLLWNQENIVNRGVQVNQTLGKYLTASFSWNDGFYSGRYNWLTGSLTYVKGPHSLSYQAGGNAGQTLYSTSATPALQNNSQMHAVVYTYTKGAWIVQPYFQYTDVAANSKLGVDKSTSTTGGAILASYAFKSGFSLPVRFEDISESGSSSVDLLGLGAGSNAVSFTATPTYQKGGIYVRADLAETHASTKAFGMTSNSQDQFRAALEFGFIFGNNITSK
jgi:hypothetical protein